MSHSNSNTRAQNLSRQIDLQQLSHNEDFSASIYSPVQKQDKKIEPVRQETLLALDNQLNKLQKIFQNYCSYGDPMNTKWLKSAKFIKLLRDCGLIKSNRTMGEVILIC